jgi:flagella basal body P-ring formation protein FlgA
MVLALLLTIGVATAQAAGTSDVCKAITHEVIDRMGPDVNVRACVVTGTGAPVDGTWTGATPDANARVGVPSWFTVSGPGRVIRVQATVHVDAPHVRAVQTLVRGRQVTADDVRPEQGAVDGARFARIPAPATLTGARMMRVVDAGAVVQALDVSIAPVVKAGESVVAVVRIGVVEVTATMTAVDNGGLGDQIRIAHRDRKRVLHATVVGPGRVEVTYER